MRCAGSEMGPQTLTDLVGGPQRHIASMKRSDPPFASSASEKPMRNQLLR